MQGANPIAPLGTVGIANRHVPKLPQLVPLTALDINGALTLSHLIFGILLFEAERSRDGAERVKVFCIKNANRPRFRKNILRIILG